MERESGMKSDIDLVIMWVDGSDDYFQSAVQAVTEKLRASGKYVPEATSRHRDSGELLFLLRAIEANMPWYRRIHIVTNGQVPRYIDFSSDRINHVTHKDIFDDPVNAPSFNTFAIESAIHRIKGLSDRYIRFSDDFFIGQPVTPDFFLGESGKGSYYFNEGIFNQFDSYKLTLQRNAVRFWEKFGYLPQHNYIHAPQLREKSVMEEMISVWPEWHAATQASRFRNEKDLVSLILYPYFSLYRTHGKRITSHVMNVGTVKSKPLLYSQFLVGYPNLDWRKSLALLTAAPPIMFNINDHFSRDGDEEGMQFVGKVLADVFPVPSPFERRNVALPVFARVLQEGVEEMASTRKGAS
jgi:hypothetical protein